MNKNILIFTRPASLPKYQILDADNKKVSILARNIDCFDTSDPAIFLFGQWNNKKNRYAMRTCICEAKRERGKSYINVMH